jgi:hypothetical protein
MYNITIVIFSIFILTTCAFEIDKMFIFADVHADMKRFIYILQDANIINSNYEWVAKPNTVVVQLGDQIDPKFPDIPSLHHFEMIYFTDYLNKQAIQNNGQFISLIGNHELYNINKIRNKESLKHIIANRPIITKVNDYLFCHGGFNKNHLYLLNEYNKTIDDINGIWNKFVYNLYLSNDEKILLDKLILDSTNSILFTRSKPLKTDNEIVFKDLDIDYMFVGHSETNIIYLYNNIWYLDLTLETAFKMKNYNYLYTQNNTIYIKSLSKY